MNPTDTAEVAHMPDPHTDMINATNFIKHQCEMILDLHSSMTIAEGLKSAYEAQLNNLLETHSQCLMAATGEPIARKTQYPRGWQTQSPIPYEQLHPDVKLVVDLYRKANAVESDQTVAELRQALSKALTLKETYRRRFNSKRKRPSKKGKRK